MRRNSPVWTSQRMTCSSSALATVWPSDEKATDSTPRCCSSCESRAVMVNDQSAMEASCCLDRGGAAASPIGIDDEDAVRLGGILRARRHGEDGALAVGAQD